MSTPGLSLVGFMQEPEARHHLRYSCVPSDASDAALSLEWQTARSKLGAPISNAGTPDIRPMAPPDDAYVTDLLGLPWVDSAIKLSKIAAFEFQLVEICPLLAFQFDVDMERSSYHCKSLSNPTIAELLPICLPQVQSVIPELMIDHKQNYLVIKERNLNFQNLGFGGYGYNVDGYQTVVFGLMMHMNLPFVHVVKFNDRYYLHNGFHRAYGAAKAGATHIPCFVRNVSEAKDAGIHPEGHPLLTFPQRLLESADPPTVGHFVHGRAHDVNLRRMSRIVHVSWTDSVMPDEGY